MKVNIIQKKISKNHNDSFWYDGLIAEVEKPNGTILQLLACGEIRIYSKKGELVHDGFKERNSEIEGGLNNDKDLEKIGNNYDDDYYWENNNWFEVVYSKKDSYIGDCRTFESDLGIVAYEYDEALIMLQSYYDDKNI